MFLRLAVLVSDGIQETNFEKLAKYYLVPDSYDFEVNEATDITNPDDLKLFHSSGRMDYKAYRKALQNYVLETGFGNLSQEHKVMVAKEFATEKSNRDSVLTIEEQVLAGIEFHRSSVHCREARLARVEAELYNRIQSSDLAQIMGVVIQGNLPYLYTRFGVEGTLSGDAPGLYDYLNATAETPWASSGLRAQSYEVDGMTIGQLADRCLDILRGDL